MCVCVLHGTEESCPGQIVSNNKIACQCRSQLSQALVATARKWASHIAAEESERLTPVVEALSTR